MKTRTSRAVLRRPPTRPRGRVTAIARAVLSGLLLASAVGCQRWQVDDRALAFPQPERRRLEIWSHGQAMLVHGVRVVGDSVLAVPYWKPPACDSCAIRFARSAIDSVRVRRTDEVRTAVAAGVVAVLFVLVLRLFSELQGLKD